MLFLERQLLQSEGNIYTTYITLYFCVFCNSSIFWSFCYGCVFDLWVMTVAKDTQCQVWMFVV